MSKPAEKKKTGGPGQRPVSSQEQAALSLPKKKTGGPGQRPVSSQEQDDLSVPTGEFATEDTVEMQSLIELIRAEEKAKAIREYRSMSPQTSPVPYDPRQMPVQRGLPPYQGGAQMFQSPYKKKAAW